MPGHEDSSWIIGKEQAEAEHGMVTSMHPLASGGRPEDAQCWWERRRRGRRHRLRHRRRRAVHEWRWRRRGDGLSPVQQRSDRRGGWLQHRAARRPRGYVRACAGREHRRAVRLARDRRERLRARASARRSCPACRPRCCMPWRSTDQASSAGSRSWQPAIELADEGFQVESYVAATTAYTSASSASTDEAFRTYFHPDGTPLQPGGLGVEPDRLVQRDLARTLRALADGGPDAFYQGEIAARIVDDLQANGGILTLDDLASYRVRELRSAARRDLPRLHPPRHPAELWLHHDLSGAQHPGARSTSLSLGAGSAAATHLVVEASRAPSRIASPTSPIRSASRSRCDGVLSKAYAAELAATIDPHRATPDIGPGDPWAYRAGRPAHHRAARPAATAATPAPPT